MFSPLYLYHIPLVRPMFTIDQNTNTSVLNEPESSMQVMKK